MLDTLRTYDISQINIYGQGNVKDAWINLCNQEEVVVIGGISDQLVAIEFLNDYLGKKEILMINPVFAKLMNLKPNQWPDRLALLDQNNQQVVVFRHWILRPYGEYLDQEVPRLTGCDLLISPNFYEQIIKSTRSGFLNATQIHRYEVEK